MFLLFWSEELQEIRMWLFLPEWWWKQVGSYEVCVAFMIVIVAVVTVNMRETPISYQLLLVAHDRLRFQKNSCCVSVQGLHPLKDSAFVVFESFRETLLTWSAVVKCDGLAFGAFPGYVPRCFTFTSRFLLPRPAKVTIYATRCRHFLSFFLLFWGHRES